jgi:hypothetical protein
MGINELLGPHREAILAIAARHGARNVRVFGSVARGDARPDSDVDLLVEFDEEKSLFDHAAFVIDLEGRLGRKVEVATEPGLKPRYRERVLQEAVVL